jgi:hypothetical protein
VKVTFPNSPGAGVYVGLMNAGLLRVPMPLKVQSSELKFAAVAPEIVMGVIAHADTSGPALAVTGLMMVTTTTDEAEGHESARL